MRLTKHQRSKVFSMFGGRCAYCGCSLPEKGWHADHVEPCLRRMEIVPKDERKNPIAFEVRHSGEFINEDANNIDNFYPSCAPCNLFKSAFSVELFRSEISKQAERARASSVNFRTAERFGLIKETGVDVVFWFEIFHENGGTIKPKLEGSWNKS